MRSTQIKVGEPSVNYGRGGSNYFYDHQNVLGQPNFLVRTTRTGVGLGEKFCGTILVYQYGTATEYETIPDANYIQDGVIQGGIYISSGNVFAGFVPDNYTPHDEMVLGHLEGVDDEFGDVEHTLTDISGELATEFYNREQLETPGESTVDWGNIVNAPPTPSGGGAVFITDINPTTTGTVGSKVMEDGVVLVSCITDTLSVTVSVTALTGPSHYKPVVTVNSVAVSNFVLAAGQWTGTVAVTLTGTGAINVTAVHEDGPTYTAVATLVAGPVFANLTFTGGYPGSQTELKANDSFFITFTADQSVDTAEIADYQAATSETFALTPGSGPFNVSLTIANRGAGTINTQAAKVRLRSTTGIWGDYDYTTNFGSGDGSATVQLNNDYPNISAISQGNITYPASQSALKDAEQATVNHTSSNSAECTFVYSSPNGDLTISNPTTFATAKTVTRLSGSYNIATTNFRITATKTTNAAVTVRNAVVYIANVACTVSLSEAYARLRSSPSGVSYTVTLTASQSLYSTPTLAALGANEGLWVGGFSGGGVTWTRTILVKDSDTKGTFTFTGLVATNLAGIVTNTITSGAAYVLGGFTFRTLTIAAWPNREVAIGCAVSNTAKLRCTNLSKGVSGSLNDTFVANTVDAVDKFTITQPSTVYNAAGNLWYNNDLSNAVSNTGGTAQIELEEIV